MEIALPHGQASAKNEQREVYMFLQFSKCVMAKVETPKFVLRAASALMRLYPAVLKTSELLDRLVR